MRRFILRARRQKPQLRFTLAAVIVLLFFALLGCGRLLLFFLNRELFADIPFLQILGAFISGVRIDAATIAVLALPPVFVALLPVKSPRWLKFWTTLLTFEFIFFAALTIADLIYFGYVKRHMGEELLSLGNDLSFIIGYISGPALAPALLLLCALAAIIWFKNKLLSAAYEPPRFKGFKELGLYIIFAALILLGVFGGFKKRPLNIPDAFHTAPTSGLANLALNGIFTSYNIIRKSNYIAANETDINAATETAVSYLIEPDETAPRPYQYPLMRHKNHKAQIGPNVIIVALESWVPQYIDGAGGGKYGVTPVFDELIRKGVYYENFYAFELRSLQGIAAILASAPALPGLPKLGYGLERAGLTSLAHILGARGYRTIFAQTSQCKSFNLCATAKNMGFGEAYGMEDMPRQFNYAKQEGYGYDYDMYALLAKKLEGQKEPFFIFAFTGITHIPYLGPLEGFNKYPETNEENRYLNALYYADYSIGRFMEEAKKQGWFNNTIFIFTADHTFNRKGSIREKYNIPLLIYGPWYLQARRAGEVGSQLDILPTVLDLLRINDNYAAAGKSLLAGGPRAALFADGYTIGIITPQGALRHTRSKTLESEVYSGGNFDAQAAQKLLLGLDKTFYTLLKEARWQEHPAPLAGADGSVQ
ncbi:MAG: sulfatase-like hydrolase/transferase [Elusimicrobiota bacterium]|jgi:phosphoglycerol transferase MdoB-like AlkP superfamily enzyme|nr:sulfatase-like hydrolase/transferase [Elusimicrobiota bacterium]